MIRYLKYIFLIFGSLALMVLIFFSFQNKKDLRLLWDYWNVLDYDKLAEVCANERRYYYPCFRDEFASYLEQAGLSGVNFGLKIAFNFMDEDKENSVGFESERVKELVYTLNYLELNNMAIDQSWRRFYGFKKVYGGYLSSLRDYLDGAKKFSDSLVAGLESEEGLASLPESETRDRLEERFALLSEEYELVYEEARGFVDREIEQFLAEVEEKQ